MVETWLIGSFLMNRLELDLQYFLFFDVNIIKLDFFDIMSFFIYLNHLEMFSKSVLALFIRIAK